jgi:hypothetical protein
MLKKALFAILAFIFLLSSTNVYSKEAAAPLMEGNLRIVESNANRILVELSIDKFKVETVLVDGGEYQKIIIPDMEQTGLPGHPMLPAKGTLLGIPTGEGLSVRILESDHQLLPGLRLAPAPGLEVDGMDPDNGLPGQVIETFHFDQTAYSQDAFNPGSPVRVEYRGLLRSQPFANLQFFPVQFNPAANEVRIYSRILVEVAWDAEGASKRIGPLAPDPLFEGILKNTLLNYETMQRPITRYLEVGLPENHQTASTGQALKIGVREPGLYQVTYQNMIDAGFDPNGIDPKTFRLTNRGTDVRILVTGEADEAFDPGDVILFYGHPYTDLYTTENIYWLTAGQGSGLRMIPRAAPPQIAAQPTHFPVTLRYEKDTFYWQTMPNGAGQDHWFWGDRISADTQGLLDTFSQTFPLNNLYAAGTQSTITARLKGYTSAAFVKPDHSSQVLINNEEIDRQKWSGFAVFDHEITIPTSQLLNNQNNTLKVVALGDTEAPVDQFFVNWFEIRTWKQYVAENNQLVFGAPNAAEHKFVITGFQGVSEVELYDITDPASPVVITGAVFSSGSLSFQETTSLQTRYLAQAVSQRKSPASIKLDTPSSWKSTDNGADYIIITHKNFSNGIQPLADHHSTSGMRVVKVDVEDLYDEFNYGIFNPQAIKDFLAYAYNNWQPPAPAYVLLVGGASYDYRSTLDLPLDRVNYVPSKMVETFLLGETASDNWFVEFDEGSVLPGMMIGRIPAETTSTLENVVAKILNYSPQSSWNKSALFVADAGETSFVNLNENLAGRLPHYYTANKVYVGQYPPGDPRVDITQFINNGSLLVNYAGHGNPNTWGVFTGQGIYNTNDVANLNNINKPVVLTTANCLNGFFVGRTRPSMAESFLNHAGGGAVAVWAPTGLGFPSGHQSLLVEFYKAIFEQDILALGAATTTAKIKMYSQHGFWGELVETFVLFGDPATPIGVTGNYPYVTSTTPASGATLVRPGQSIQVRFFKPMDASTVQLTVNGPGAPAFSPTWNADGTVVTFNHSGFLPGTSYTAVIQGQDRLGQPLGAGIAPSTWTFRVAASELFLPMSLKNR